MAALGIIDHINSTHATDLKKAGAGLFYSTIAGTSTKLTEVGDSDLAYDWHTFNHDRPWYPVSFPYKNINDITRSSLSSFSVTSGMGYLASLFVFDDTDGDQSVPFTDLDNCDNIIAHLAGACFFYAMACDPETSYAYLQAARKLAAMFKYPSSTNTVNTKSYGTITPYEI